MVLVLQLGDYVDRSQEVMDVAEDFGVIEQLLVVQLIVLFDHFGYCYFSLLAGVMGQRSMVQEVARNVLFHQFLVHLRN